MIGHDSLSVLTQTIYAVLQHKRYKQNDEILRQLYKRIQPNKQAGYFGKYAILDEYMWVGGNFFVLHLH